jgi:hypothetical protein
MDTQQEQGMSAVIDIVGDFAKRAQTEKWDVRLSTTGNPVVMIRQRVTDAAAFCSLVCADHIEAARVVALARGEK